MDAKRRRIRVKVVVSALVFALIAATVLIAARVNFPLRKGNPADFWYAACRVKLNDNVLDSVIPSPQAYPARGGWCVYSRPTMHGEPLHRIPEEEAFADFPEVVRRLEEGGNRPPYFATGLARWREKDPDRSQPHVLLEELRAARLNDLLQHNPSIHQYALEREQSVDERWSMAHDWWPILVVIELAFFEFLAAFALWPWWRSARPAWYVVHLGWLPWLFLLPHWLGYAPLTFTSAASTDEGVLYPALLWSVPRVPWTGLDTLLLRPLPRPLVSWSLGPGPMLSISGTGSPGVLTAPLGSVLLAVVPLLLALSEFARESRNRPRHGSGDEPVADQSSGQG
jgi:hypothetical protein